MTTQFPGGLDSFATDVDNQSFITAAESNNQSAAILALEKYGRPVVNIVGFGGKGDNSTDNTPALTAALAALSSSGGTIYFPASVNSYNFASAWNLAGKNFIRFAGAGPTYGGGSATASLIRFTGTTGPLVAAAGTTGIELEDLYVQWPAAFTGTVVDFSGCPSGDALRRCFFSANGGGSSAAVIVGLDNAQRVTIERSHFHNAQVGIQGLATAGHFSIAIKIRDCNFSSGTGDIAVAHISNPHQNWVIADNVFEMGQGAGNASIITTPLSTGPGMTFVGNWSGDQGTNAVTQINAGNGWLISGNYLAGKSTTTCISVPNNASGVIIAGNEFDTFSVAVLVGTTVNNIQIGPNDRLSVSTYVSGTPNSGGMLLTNGTAVLYGASTVQGDFSTDRGIGPGTPAVATQAGRIYQGSGVPSNTNGNNGDIYFRTDTPGTANQRMYMKSAGAWVALTL